MGAGSQLASKTLKTGNYGQSNCEIPFRIVVQRMCLGKVEIMVNRKVGKLEIVFIDKEGKWYPIDEVDQLDLAEGLEKVSKEVAKRLQLLKDQR